MQIEILSINDFIVDINGNKYYVLLLGNCFAEIHNKQNNNYTTVEFCISCIGINEIANSLLKKGHFILWILKRLQSIWYAMDYIL